MEKRINMILYSASVAVLSFIIYSLYINDPRLWIILSSLGDEVVYAALTIAIYILIDMDLGVYMLHLIILSGSVNISLKSILMMPRPPKEYWLIKVRGPGFPSGHMQVAATFWTRLILEYRGVALVFLSISCLMGIGLSRIMLGVHYPVDVAGGLLIGTLISIALYMAIRRFGTRGFYISLAIVLTASCIAVWIDGIYIDESLALLGASMGTIIYPVMKRYRRYVMSLKMSTRIMIFVLSTITASPLLYITRCLPLERYLISLAYMIITVIVLLVPALLAKYISFKRS